VADSGRDFFRKKIGRDPNEQADELLDRDHADAGADRADELLGRDHADAGADQADELLGRDHADAGADQADELLGMKRDPIRLGGFDVNKSIDALGAGEDKRPLAERIAAPEPETRLLVDWERIARRARLSRLEKKIFDAHWRHEIPRYRLARELGITPRAATRCVESIALKLRGLGRTAIDCFCDAAAWNSAALARSERGKQRPAPPTWTPAPFDKFCFEVMQHERFIHLISQSYSAETEKGIGFWGRISRREFVEQLAEMRKRLKEVERPKLAQLIETEKNPRAAYHAAVEAQGNLRERHANEEAESIFKNEIWPSREARQRVEEAEERVEATAATAKAASVAMRRQQEIVDQLEIEVQSKKHLGFAAALRPLKQAAVRAMEACAAEVKKIPALAAEWEVSGDQVQFELFPHRMLTIEGPDYSSMDSGRQAYIGMMLGTLAFEGARMAYRQIHGHDFDPMANSDARMCQREDLRCFIEREKLSLAYRKKIEDERLARAHNLPPGPERDRAIEQITAARARMIAQANEAIARHEAQLL